MQNENGHIVTVTTITEGDRPPAPVSRSDGIFDEGRLGHRIAVFISGGVIAISATPLGLFLHVALLIAPPPLKWWEWCGLVLLADVFIWLGICAALWVLVDALHVRSELIDRLFAKYVKRVVYFFFVPILMMMISGMLLNAVIAIVSLGVIGYGLLGVIAVVVIYALFWGTKRSIER